VCGKRKNVHKNRVSGKAVCPACYQKDPSTHEQCSECREVKPVKARTEDGKAVCPACYRRSKVGKCNECKKTKVIQALGLCYGCYQLQRRKNMAYA
ncbi:MAG: hypothetical protein AAB877_00430, partial [Patescibacteria group bacterium]